MPSPQEKHSSRRSGRRSASIVTDLTLLTADDGLLCLEADAVLSYLPEIPGGFVQLRSGDHATVVEQVGSPAELVSALAARIRASRAVTLRQERGDPADLTGITEICVSYSAGLDVAKAIAAKLQAALPSAVLVYAADCKHVKIIVWYSGQHQSGSVVRIEGGVARTIIETEGDAGKLITAFVEAYRLANRGKD